MKRNNFISTSLKDYTYNNSASLTNKSPTKESNYANNNKNQMMVKEFLDCNKNNSNNSHSNTNGEDYMNGAFPWPPRSYTCSFCRKEFKSAQALGGHMNVHRRDRARLRHSSPPPPPTPTTDHHHGHGHGQAHPMLNLNLNPNTNPNFSSSSSTSSSNVSLLPSSWSSHHSSSPHKPPATSTLPLFVSPTSLPTLSPSYASTTTSELKRWVVVDGILLKNPLSTKISEPSKPKVAESLGGIIGDDDDDVCKIMKKKNEILRMDLEIGLPREYDLDLELRLGNYS
ncbi:hypothetical protein RIF29_38984 [Crotalaria pallida]|uniref:C2H2-type domain-containing protein n=1 Tax=Crotalaria pallida TaxID=3830 RepID=A0AAN9E252_CROPI